MIIEILFFIAGIYFLVAGADYIIDSSSKLAKRAGVSEFVIGLTIVAVGTSLPEFVVSIFASFQRADEIILGNIIGSNIANILLIIGVLAFVGKVHVNERNIKTYIAYTLLAPLLLLIIALMPILKFSRGLISEYSGILFILIAISFLNFIAKNKKEVNKNGSDKTISAKKSLVKLTIGLIGVYFGGKFVVEGAIYLARIAGISEFLISATIIAAGTSLPELVVSIISLKRKRVGIALGNVIGSNVINVFAILGLTSVISPIRVPMHVIPDLLLMLSSSMYLFYFAKIHKSRVLKRKEGIILLVSYLAYVVFTMYRG